MSIPLDTASHTALREIRFLRKGANNAIQKSRNEIDLAVLTASDIDKAKEVEPLIDSLEKCVTANVEKFTDIDGDFSDDIEEWKNELEAVKTVWELCLDKWHDQLKKNKKVLEVEIDVADGTVRDGVGDSSGSSPAELSDDELGDISTPPEKDSAVSGSGPAPPDTTVVKDEMKTEPVELPMQAASVSTQPDLAEPVGAPDSGYS